MRNKTSRWRRIAVVVLASVVAGGFAVRAMAADHTGAAQHAAAKRSQQVWVVKALRGQLRTYLDAHSSQDRMTTVGLRVTYRGRTPATSVTVSTDPASRKHALWQIGSNTKAFTAVLLLQLESEGRLSIDDTLGRWLPQYPSWSDITIQQLLSMTSGIPDYSQQDAFGEAILSDPSTRFTSNKLVSYVAGLPLGPATYSYSNTNYILAQMIIERATHHSYAAELKWRILGPLRMHDTCLPPYCPPGTAERMPAGYSAHAGLPSSFGNPVPPLALSWAEGAGGLVGSLKDLTTWDRALYQGRMLPRAQQRQLESLISTTTSKPISVVTAQDPSGYGLGVAQRIDSSTGRPVWAYRGETFGFQVVHMYVPETGTVIALAVNSATDQDTVDGLADAVHRTLAASRPSATG